MLVDLDAQFDQAVTVLGSSLLQNLGCFCVLFASPKPMQYWGLHMKCRAPRFRSVAMTESETTPTGKPSTEP